MSKGSKNLLVGMVIGATAGFIAGVIVASSKVQKVDMLKAKISDLAADAQEKIKALRSMAAKNNGEVTNISQN